MQQVHRVPASSVSLEHIQLVQVPLILARALYARRGHTELDQVPQMWGPAASVSLEHTRQAQAYLPLSSAAFASQEHT